MSFWDNVKKFAQPYADDEYDEYDEEEVTAGIEEEQEEERPARRRAPAFNFSGNDTAATPAAPATPDEVNVFAGATFEHNGTFYSRTAAHDNPGSELTDGIIVTDENIAGNGYSDNNLCGWQNMNNKTLTLSTTLDGDYNLNKFVFYTVTNAANKSAGMTEPYTIKAFYKNAEGEWVQFGATFTSTETDDAESATKTTVIEISADAVVTSEVKFEVALRAGKGLLFFSELEAWGYAAQ